MHKFADFINSRVSPPGGQWYGPGAGGRWGGVRGGGAGAAEPSQSEAGCVETVQTCRVAPRWITVSVAGRRKFGAVLVSSRHRTCPQLAQVGREEEKGEEEEGEGERQEPHARGTVDLNHPSGCSELPEQVGPEGPGVCVCVWGGVLRARVAEVEAAVMWVIGGPSVSGCLGGGEGRLTSPRITAPNTSVLSFRRVNPRSVPSPPRHRDFAHSGR